MILYRFNDNCFNGEDIEYLRPEDDGLADYWILKLKNGQELKLAIDWRGQDAYIGLYKEPEVVNKFNNAVKELAERWTE